jgi:chromosome segregation ATPase
MAFNDTIKELQVEREKLLAKIRPLNNAIHKLNAKIERLIKQNRKKRQEKCPHTKTKERTDGGYFEQGRMTAPLYWNEKVCVRCGKVVEKEETKKVWKKA